MQVNQNWEPTGQERNKVYKIVTIKTDIYNMHVNQENQYKCKDVKACWNTAQAPWAILFTTHNFLNAVSGSSTGLR